MKTLAMTFNALLLSGSLIGWSNGFFEWHGEWFGILCILAPASTLILFALDTYFKMKLNKRYGEERSALDRAR